MPPDGGPLVDGDSWSAPGVRARVRAATTAAVELVRFEGEDHGQRYDVLPPVLLRVVREFGGTVALDCWVETPGRVAVGDAVELRTTVDA